MTKQLESLLDFIVFTHDIRNVKRAMFAKGEETLENDSEHSYQLAMTALYIIEEQRLKLDAYKSMGLALVHDVLEVHAGDTSVFDSQAVLSKAKREEEAVLILKKQWPKLIIMHQLIDEYEARKTPESKFVYALDKLLPILNNYLDNGRFWIQHGIKLNQMIAVKTGKVDVDPTIEQYYKIILERLKEHPEFFVT